MNYGKLEKNMIDVIKEQVIKLGFMNETIRLYYPKDSLAAMLGEKDLTHDQLKSALIAYRERVKEGFGSLKMSQKGDRYCFIIPPQGVSYVNGLLKDQEFIIDFVEKIREGNCTIEQLLDVFKKYSKDVCCMEETHGEFDYVVFFENGEPDDYRYCIKFENGHTIYHRFTKEDYEAFRF